MEDQQDFEIFLDNFIKTIFFKKIIELCHNNYEITKFQVLLIESFVDYKYKRINPKKIKEVFDILFLIVNFSEEEKESFVSILNTNDIKDYIVVPDIDFINTHYYDSTYNRIIRKKPFNSWTFNKTTFSWDPPIPFPKSENGEIYYWNESNLNWEVESD